uniref:NADH dehydrogenase subunit 4 n=1 Tax=Rhynchocinetes brucei TaxID=1531312 RepID=UPI0026E33643|nr:NADH dehydrogenase subunit 4 [Rhynchocinetes brucei]WJM99851.1 NADH dehydrogenase subunit 4 [Rhynchocinetes brucei]
MLKMIFFVMFMIFVSGSWNVVSNMLFMGTMLMVMSCMGNYYLNCLGFYLGMDTMSFCLILLSFWISGLVVCASNKVNEGNKFPSSFLVINLLLLLSLVLSFSSIDYLLFYISFESSLIPTLILILGWGYQEERVQAGWYMLFYTLFASLPLLLSFMVMYKFMGSLNMQWTLFFDFSSKGLVNHIWFLSSICAFLVKLPVFMGHLWLPKAHVEAPVSGSMILAGVLLKLGGYGLIRVMPMFLEVSKKYVWFWMSVGLVGGIFTSLICLRQSDIKSLIAYSSVGHMGLVMCGLFTGGLWGVSGALIVMLGHGLCSSGLFCISNMMYERTSSRSLFISKGMMSLMPSMSMWWFLLSISNMAAPPSLSLLGEICLISSIISWSKISIFGVSFLLFLGAAYSLYMYALTQHGKKNSSIFCCCSGKMREFLVLMLHWLPLNFLILKSSMFVF